MPDWDRSKALMTMTCSLGDDAFIPVELTAEERISEPFKFEVYAISQHGVVDPTAVLYHPACVKLQANGQLVRYFHGVVRSLTAEGSIRGGSQAGDYQMYRMTLVPLFWFLNQTVDCRVFQNVTVVDVLTQLFNDLSMTGTTFPPPGAQREYVVQFNESDMNLVTRLMEEEGYFYIFQHSAGEHKLVIADQNSAFTDVEGARLHMGGGDSDAALLADFDKSMRTVRGQMKFKDYDPEKPDTLLQNQQPTTLKISEAQKRDDFRWPALTFDNGTVTARTRREMEAAEAVASLYEGSCRFGALIPGGKFAIENKPAGTYDGNYVLQAVTHRASDDTWLNQDGSAAYFNRFIAFESAVSWRQPMTTPRPRMDGVHTALVLGPQHGDSAEIKAQSGEEIHTDDLARVKVRFFWDHRAQATGNESCWARVVMPWAGPGWGAQFIPRVGTEVAIAFVDGDPDRPIVIGGLYNGRDTPIYSKADKTKSGFRSRSSLKGGTSEFNEFTFDDKKGHELVYTQAQKDQTTYVKNDQTLTVDNCRIVTVKKDETVDIQNNQTIKIKQDHSLTVTDGNHSTAVQTGDHSLKVATGNLNEQVSMGNHSTDVSMGNVSLKAGMGAIANEAMQSIELKVGQTDIKIDQTGVTIKGMMITIEGQVQTQVKGLMTQVNGDAMLQLKGGITMIN
jgi:type VI secretion system secreted protein VgrG